MKLGDPLYVVVRHTARTVSVVEGDYLGASEDGDNATVAWVDDSGLVSFADRGDVFATKEAAEGRKLSVAP